MRRKSNINDYIEKNRQKKWIEILQENRDLKKQVKKLNDPEHVSSLLDAIERMADYQAMLMKQIKELKRAQKK